MGLSPSQKMLKNILTRLRFFPGEAPRAVSFFPFIASLFLALFFWGCSSKKEPFVPLSGTISFRSGTVHVFKGTDGKWTDLKIFEKIHFGDSLKTMGESQVEITFGMGNTIRIAENSKIRITPFRDSTGSEGMEVYNFFGEVLSNIKKVSAKREHYLVRTQTAVAAVRGTYFSVSFVAISKTSQISVIGGTVWVHNPRAGKGHVALQPGHFTLVGFGKIPGTPKKLNYGQLKKIGRLMPPGSVNKYSGKLKIKPGKGFKFKTRGGKGKPGKFGKKGKFRKSFKGVGKKFKNVFKKKPKGGKGKKKKGKGKKGKGKKGKGKKKK